MHTRRFHLYEILKQANTKVLEVVPKQEYWSGLPFSPPGDHPNPGIKPRSPALQADSLPSEPSRKPHILHLIAI